MAGSDREHWDARYAGREPMPMTAVGLPEVFAPYQDLFPVQGRALDLACGPGLSAVWLARRGLDVLGVDISAVAISRARELAQRNGIGENCRFEVVDLDDGLPPGPVVAVIMCSRFRDARLDDDISARLAPGGLLAISALSEVGATPGRFRVAPGELSRSFAGLEQLAAGEGNGEAWLIARTRG